MSTNGRRSSLRLRFPLLQQYIRVPPKAVSRDDVEDDDGIAQELKKTYRTPKKSTRTADATASSERQREHEGDDYSNGGDSSDSDVAARPRSSGQRASRPSIPQLPAPSTPSKSGKMTIEKAYPGLFLPLTRENIQRIFNERQMKVDMISFLWKKNTVDYDKEQFSQMKIIVQTEVSKHFIAFSTAKCVGWAIKTKFPWLDCSTQLFRDLRYQGYHHSAALKHDFLYEKLYSYLLGIIEEFPGFTKLTDNELIPFLGARFDKDLAINLWGRCIRVLDTDKTFAESHHTRLGAWYMRQVYLNMSLKLLPVIISEVPANPKLKWIKKSPTGWNADKARREEVSWFFDCLCIATEVDEVELDAFEWVPDQAPMPPLRAARTSGKPTKTVTHGTHKPSASRASRDGVRRRS